MTDYSRFKVLIDEPAENPGLSFPEYANAFAEIILQSRPQFAIGVFGDWGSGKTTLMQAIRAQLERTSSDKVVTVWFNAWRYEREQHLIVPMLDTLREALVDWANAHPEKKTPSQNARRAAATVGKAARSLLAGFSVRGGVPFGVAELAFEPAKVMEQLDDARAANDPSSFYHASFNAMKSAVERFVGNRVRRVVVFIDDLDRCLPLSALEVLESMKLFFDLEGFVFVVGLDQTVIERAIESKYKGSAPSIEVRQSATANGQPATDASALRVTDDRQPPVSGAEYVKKIFQVPFALPRITTGELEKFFEHLIRNADLTSEQSDSFTTFVQPHLQYLSGDQTVNPREVKRLLNAYTLQLKMLQNRELPPDGLRPDVVVTLQTIDFRADWQRLYDELAVDPELFAKDVEKASASGLALDAWTSNGEPLPQAFLNYVNDAGKRILQTPLRPYLSSAEASRSTQHGLLDAQAAVGYLLRRLQDLKRRGAATSEDVSGLQSQLEIAANELRRMSVPLASVALAALEQVRKDISLIGGPEPLASERWGPYLEDVGRKLQGVLENLRELRRQTNVGAVAA